MLRAKQTFFALLAAVSIAAISLSPASAQTPSQSGCVQYINNVCTTMQTCELTAGGHGTCYYYVRGQYAYYQNF
jgi:hypothetical protein